MSFSCTKTNGSQLMSKETESIEVYENLLRIRVSNSESTISIEQTMYKL